jgi:hypothetical protein
MKTFSSVLNCSFAVWLLLLVSFPLRVYAAQIDPTGYHHSLSVSPLSSAFLMAQFANSGLVHLASQYELEPNNTRLTCKPAPCVLPDEQASEGGKQVDEDPIAASPINGQDLLTGGNDYNCPSYTGFYRSLNRGKTWNRTCLPLLPGYIHGGDPGLGYDLHGNAYITGLDINNAGQAVVAFAKSIPGGGWTSPAIAVSPTFSGGLADKDWLQVDDTPTSPYAGALYISATQEDQQTNSQISVSHSYDGGNTWTTVLVDTEQMFHQSVDQWSDLAIGKDGTVYVSWERCTPNPDCGNVQSRFYVSRSTDGGNTWSTPTLMATAQLPPDTGGCFYGCLPHTSERVSPIPAIDIDNSSGKHAGNLYAVIPNWTGTYLQVEVTSSTDGGNTWRNPISVTPSSDTHDQFFPWLSVSQTGIVGVTWLDRRDDPNDILYKAYAAVSKDGRKFSVNVPIASAQSDPRIDQIGFIGDYTGNTWSSNTLFASWMDSRNGLNMQDEVGGYRDK